MYNKVQENIYKYNKKNRFWVIAQHEYIQIYIYIKIVKKNEEIWGSN